MSSSAATRLFLALLLADAGFVVLHLLESVGPFWRDAFRMDEDNSLAEFFQYSKTIASAVCLGLLARQWRSMLLWVPVRRPTSAALLVTRPATSGRSSSYRDLIGVPCLSTGRRSSPVSCGLAPRSVHTERWIT